MVRGEHKKDSKEADARKKSKPGSQLESPNGRELTLQIAQYRRPRMPITKRVSQIHKLLREETEHPVVCDQVTERPRNLPKQRQDAASVGDQWGRKG